MMSYYAMGRQAQLDIDAARLEQIERVHALDDMCAWCREEDCPAAFGGGPCPLEQEQDYQDLQDLRFAASRGTL